MSHYKNHWLLFILPVLGISFWFALGFPFADRNESYIWINFLQKYSFVEIIQNPIPSIRSFRPLAQALTWLLYQLSGENSVLIQLVNFILLCAAIWIMIPLMEGAKTFYLRLFYFLIGFIYFSTFYYVFNLHGIFYSPILLIIALFLRSPYGVLNNWKWWLFICMILTFFHPLILVFYVAYLSGSMLEKHHVDWKKVALLIIIFAGLFVMLDLLLPYSLFSIINIQNLLGTVRNVENHAVVKIFTILLCFLPLLNKSGQQKTIYAGLIAIYAPLALMYNLPFLLLLAFLIVVSLVAEGKWSLVGLVLASISFPIVVGSGAPTKASIFIFLLPYLLLRPLSLRQVTIAWLPKSLAIAALAFIIFSAAMVRMEVTMPLLSVVIRPILVEKGKTHQLEKGLMLARQQSSPRRIHFLQEKQTNIRDFGQPMTRDNFPPTKQSELDVYQPRVFSHPVSNKSPVWYMSFGSSIQSDTLRLIHVLEEKNCKPAYLYERIIQ